MNLNPDFEIIEIPGDETLPRLCRLQDELPHSGKYPFIVGDRHSLQMLREAYHANSNAQLIDIAHQKKLLDMEDEDDQA